MSVRTPLAALLALLLGVCAAGLVACGAENRALIPQSSASRLNEDLDAVRAAVQDGACERATAALARLERDIGRLPDSTSVRIRNELQRGAQRLVELAPQECRDNQPTQTTPTTPTQTTPTETTPTTTTPTETTPTTTTPTETTPTTTTPTETTPTTPAPTTPTVPPDNGGTEIPDQGGGTGGVTPGGEAGTGGATP